MGLPLRIAARPPLIATGTTGACASIAMMKPPFLNGRRSPVRLRVPSGKIRNELPALSDSAPLRNRLHGLLPVAALDGNEAADVEHRPHDRELVELRLVEDVEAPVQRLEQDRRIDVAFVVRAKDHGRVRECAPGR